MVSLSGTKEDGERSSGTESAGRVADVLLLFADEPGSLGVTEISRRLGLSKAVVHRIVRSLVSRDLLAADGRSYRLGAAAVALGARAFGNLDLPRAAMPALRELQIQTEETATVTALVGNRRVYLDQIPSLKEIKMTVELGRPFPLHAGASGKVILAFAPPGLKEQALSGELEKMTPLTVVERSKLEEELQGIEESGTAASHGERQHGAGSVAAPVFGVDGYALGSISVCGPVDRFDEETVSRLVPLVRDAAHRISRKIGFNDTEKEI